MNCNWQVVQSGRPMTDALPKNEAYRRCRELNGKRAGGNRTYTVKRINHK